MGRWAIQLLGLIGIRLFLWRCDPSMTICAIHQPNFFPWLGYFDKIRRADTFVFLDKANYPKSGNSMGCWCNRVRINVNGQGAWISCPVVREHGVQPINTVRIDNKRPWRNAIRRTIENNYRKAPNFVSAFPLIDSLLGFESDSLAEFNTNAIVTLAGHCGLTTRFVAESELPSIELTSTARLMEIVKAVGADTYLCGGGASGYQDDAAFPEAGLKIVYQNFSATPYGNPSRFIPGLSIIDWLMDRSDRSKAGLI
jgi:hypothetical protein